MDRSKQEIEVQFSTMLGEGTERLTVSPLPPSAWGTIPTQVLRAGGFMADLQGRHVADLNSLPVDPDRLSFH